MMKRHAGGSGNEKLRRKLKQLFKTDETKCDVKNENISRKRPISSVGTGKLCKNIDNSEETKLKVEGGQFVTVPDTEASPKPKRKSNAKQKSRSTQRNVATDGDEAKQLNGKTTKNNHISTKKPKNNPKNNQATAPQSSEPLSFSLVHHSDTKESGGSENDEYEYLVDDYNAEDSSSDEDDYFGSSYSDDFSLESDEFFDDTDTSKSEDSDYSECSENSFQYESYCSAGSDPDYELPDDVPEDLIIHEGTAQKLDLKIEDGIQFDSDDDEPQIVEMCGGEKMQEIKQPDAYSKTELYKLNVKSINRKQTITKNDLELSSDSEKSCPALVPIVDEDDFELYNSDSDSSFYAHLSESSSMSEEDINLKYVRARQECDSDCEEKGNRMIRQKQPFGIGIINVENCTPQKTGREFSINGCVEKAEADSLISVQAINKVTPKIMENHIIAVNICENFISETFKDNHSKKQKLDSSLTLSSDSGNTNGIQTLQRVNEEIDIDAYEDSAMSFPETSKNANISDSPTNELQSPKVGPVQKIAKSLKETLTSRTLFINAVNSNFVLVLVKDPFYLYGTVCVTLLAGNIEVYGYKPRLNEEFEIFSPRGCSTVQITSIGTKLKTAKIADKLKSLLSAFSSVDLRRIETDFESGKDAVLLLTRNVRRKKLKKIFRNYMNENVFPNMNSIQRDRPYYASEYQLDCVINVEADRCLKVPQEWKMFCFTTKSQVLLAGGKSVGKSTLLRYLLNAQLEHCKQVLVIDLDIGQAELFVPQTVSCTVLNKPLIGPGFFLNQQPTRSYVVGHSNIVLCAHAYMRAVKELIDFCYTKAEFSEMPWLINTMGYNKGFGLELMSVLVQLIKPTDVIQLKSNKEINNFDDLLYPHILASSPRIIYTDELFKEENDKSAITEYRLHVLNSAILQESRYQRDWEMSAKDLRYATFLSRLSDVLHGNAEWLTDCVPLSASMKELSLINMGGKENTREDLIHAIEANLVYLCQREEENSDPLKCVGIGIVRCTDIEKVYLLPAMPYEYLNKVNCLALGEMPLPSSLFTNQGPKVRNMAAFLYNTVDARTSKSIKQIYHRPSHFLQGKHKDVLNN